MCVFLIVFTSGCGRDLERINFWDSKQKVKYEESLDGRVYRGSASRFLPTPGCEGCGSPTSVKFRDNYKLVLHYADDDQYWVQNYTREGLRINVDNGEELILAEDYQSLSWRENILRLSDSDVSK